MTPQETSNPAVDVHTHLAPKLSSEALADLGLGKNEKGQYLVGSSPLGPATLYNPESLVEFLEKNSLDLGYVSVPPPFYRQNLGLEETRKWCSAINEGIIEATNTSEKLCPLVYLPLNEPAVAIETVRTYLSNDGVVGWNAAAGSHSLPLDDPAFEELWHLLAADGRPLLLHPGMSPDARLKDFYLHNLLGNPVETGVAVGQLVLGGVLEKNPQLKLILVHCGGVVPSVAARWQRGIDTARPDVNKEAEPVYETLRRIHTDCLTHDPKNVDLAAHIFGEDRLLLGSDWPFPMGLNDPRESIRHLNAAVQEKIARENPKKLFYPSK